MHKLWIVLHYKHHRIVSPTLVGSTRFRPLCHFSIALVCLGQQLCDLSTSMKKRQHELYDILSIAAETDAKLCASNERYAQVDEAADTSWWLISNVRS